VIRRVECGCGFAVEGEDDDVVSAAQAHAQVRHAVPIGAALVLALAEPVEPARRPTKGEMG